MPLITRASCTHKAKAYTCDTNIFLYGLNGTTVNGNCAMSMRQIVVCCRFKFRKVVGGSATVEAAFSVLFSLAHSNRHSAKWTTTIPSCVLLLLFAYCLLHNKFKVRNTNAAYGIWIVITSIVSLVVITMHLARESEYVTGMSDFWQMGFHS